MNTVDATSEPDVPILETAATIDPALMRVVARVAHREHLHAGRAVAGVPARQTSLTPTHFTRRRPVAVSGALTGRTRGTTARKVIWS